MKIKKALLFLFLLYGLGSPTFAQTAFQTNNLAAFCKVWGFLKYYHPYPSKKSVDWDTVLVNNYPKVKAAQSKEEFNRILISISQKLGELKPIKHPFTPADSESINADFKWIDDTTVLSVQVCHYLQRVKKNHKPFKNKYVRSNPNAIPLENPYPKMFFPNESYRFLALSRYWNIIQYYFPDKYLMDTNWNISLQRAIPIFMSAADTDEYYRAIQWITARTDDGHAAEVASPTNITNYRWHQTSSYFNDDTLIINYTPPDSVTKAFNIKKGDRIVSIDGISVKEKWKDVRAHHSASNESYALYWFANNNMEMSKSKKDSSELVIIRDGKRINTKIRNYTNQEILLMWLHSHPLKAMKPIPEKPAFEIRLDTISGKRYGYVNLGVLRNKQISLLFKQMKGIDYLVLDGRNYPHNLSFQKLSKRIVYGKHYVANYTQPDYDYPGYIKYYTHPDFAFLQKRVGTKKKNYYKGKVIILVDHKTGSAAEYQAMALRIAQNSIVIGTQTAGADGDASPFVFPGNYSVYFTGLGWFYADWKQTQRIGIVPDIKVDYTLESRMNKRDPIMQRALEFIRTGK